VARQQRRWVRIESLTSEEKAAIAALCERFIEETLKPRFLPEILPTRFNYAVELLGKWRGNRYSFATRFRSGFPDNTGEEFNSAFTRLDYVEGTPAGPRFDVMWLRHTGQWFRLHAGVTLEEALHLIDTDSRLHPYT
jgi:hypothetical protein